MLPRSRRITGRDMADASGGAWAARHGTARRPVSKLDRIGPGIIEVLGGTPARVQRPARSLVPRVRGPDRRVRWCAGFVVTVVTVANEFEPLEQLGHREFEALAQLAQRPMARRELTVFEAADRVRR